MWKETEKYLEKTFVFENFVDAVDFINRIVPLAEGKQHHPDILLFGYKHVKVMLFTHDENRITAKDHDLAKKINNLV